MKLLDRVLIKRESRFILANLIFRERARGLISGSAGDQCVMEPDG